MTGDEFHKRFKQSMDEAKYAALFGLTKQASDKAYSEHMKLCTSFANELCNEIGCFINEKTTNLTGSLIAHILRTYAETCDKCSDGIGKLLAAEFAIEVPLKLSIVHVNEKRRD